MPLDVDQALRRLAAHLALERPLAILDLETTGIDPERDRIVEIALVVLHPDGTSERFASLVHPEGPIPAAATRVHGITDADVATAPTFRGLAPALARRFAGVDFAGYGIARFDLRVLAAEFARVDVAFDAYAARVLDAMQIFFHHQPRDLAAALRTYCGVAHAGHRAAADVDATIAVLAAQLERHTELPRDLAGLDALCNRRDPARLTTDGKIVWRDGTARLSFGRHAGAALDELRRTNPDYLRWIAGADFAADTRRLAAEALAGRMPQGPDDGALAATIAAGAIAAPAAAEDVAGKGLRVLLTNTTLATRTGTALYVRDLARALLARGCRPVVYSPDLGEVADEIRAATIPVVDDLDALGAPPDVIHGHHHPETVTALLRFPGVPALFVCHDWAAWHDAAPRFARIRRYGAVSEALRDRLAQVEGIPDDRIVLLPSFVDLARFRPRPPLPPRPARALVFGNSIAEASFLAAVERACTEAGIALDTVGAGTGTDAARPEDLLPCYDLVFATGRSALEAVAVGAAVVVADARGVGAMVTGANWDELRALDFALRALRRPVGVPALARAIAAWDPAGSAAATAAARATAGVDAAADRLIALYQALIREEAVAEPSSPAAERRAAAAYLQRLAPWRQLRDAARRAHESEEQQRALACRLEELGTAHAESARRLDAAERARADATARLHGLTASPGGRALAAWGALKHRWLLPAWRHLRTVLRARSTT